MAVDVSKSSSAVLEMKRELAECLSEDKFFCENALRSVIDSIVNKIEKLRMSRFDFDIICDIKAKVVEVRLGDFKKKCMDCYYQQVLAIFADDKIVQLLEDVKKAGSIQDKFSETIIKSRAFDYRQSLANFVLIEADKMRFDIFSDIKGILSKKNIPCKFPERFVI